MRRLAAVVWCAIVGAAPSAFAQDVPARQSEPEVPELRIGAPFFSTALPADPEQGVRFRFVAADPGQRVVWVRVISGGSSFDPILRVRTRSGFRGSDDDGAGFPNALLRVPLAEDDTVDIWVEDYNREGGAFEIEAFADRPADRGAQEGALAFNRQMSCSMRPDAESMDITQDVFHPRRFVRFREYPVNGWASRRARGADSGQRAARGEDLVLTGEVDYRSQVGIEWDRSAVEALVKQLDFSFSVSARLESASGSRAVQVSSYSMIGQSQRTVSASLRNLGALRSAMCQFVSAHAKAFDGVAGDPRFDDDDLAVFARNLEMLEPELREPLRIIAGNSDAFALLRIQRKSGVSPGAVRQYAQRLEVLLTAAVASEDSASLLRSARRFEEEAVNASLAFMDYHQQTEQMQGLTRELVAAQLKDGDISLREAGAAPGDELVITIENDVLGDSVPRRYQVRLRVVAFGATQRTEDSFLFLTRLGTGSAQSAQGIVSSLSPTQLAQATEVGVPLPMRMRPTPGVTLGWRFYPRMVQSGDRMGLRQFARAVRPGVGVNVSLVSFPTRRVTYAVDATTGDAVLENAEDVSDDMQLAAGAVFSLFDGAMSLSVGRNFGETKDPGYFAVGFSFANLAAKLTAPK